MKTVGIIGGLSPESTVAYYHGLNKAVQNHLGGHHSAKIILNSVDFGTFVALKEKGDWDTQAMLLCDAAQSLEKAGADFVIMATNTMHKMADQIEKAISIPFIHIADATAKKIKKDGLSKIGLLGTKYTMELGFYKNRLEKHSLETLIPNEHERISVNSIIYDELCHGIIKDSSRKTYEEIINDITMCGAQGIILGCTEITLLVKKSFVPLYDTTQIHIDAAFAHIFD